VILQERVIEAQEIIDRVTRWAAHRQDIVGLLLVGSYARNAARPDSDIDIDIVLLTTDHTWYFNNTWAASGSELIRVTVGCQSDVVRLVHDVQGGAGSAAQTSASMVGRRGAE
jgi:predicted nucleotidyltransferase